MIHRSRAWLALLLVVTMPLRAMAALAMPCCATDASRHHASSNHASSNHASSHHASTHQASSHHAMSMTSGDMPTTNAAPLTAHDDGAHGAGFDCCAIAMIPTPPFAVIASAYAPPFAAPLRTPPLAAFVTEAPERPPRA